METVCHGLETIFIYIDDILAASENERSHKWNLSQLIDRLRDNGLVINKAKCQIGCPSIDFLGHHITQQGATALTDNVEAIATFKQPTTIKGLHRFVGMVNFYRRFIPFAARIMAPLFPVLSSKANVPKLLVWTEDMLRAFREAKEALIKSTLLAHPCKKAPIALTTNGREKQ